MCNYPNVFFHYITLLLIFEEKITTQWEVVFVGFFLVLFCFVWGVQRAIIQINYKIKVRRRGGGGGGDGIIVIKTNGGKKGGGKKKN